MNAEGRQAVLDSARYLRSVRPLDPEELATYVEGGAHPAAVRQVLREAALDLDLLERPDGTFGPVPDEPLSPVDPDSAAELDHLADPTDPGPPTVAIAAFPDQQFDPVADALVERFGPDWQDGDSGDHLRRHIRDLKEAYLQDDHVEYDAVAALGYALYHLPATYAAARYELRALAREGLLDRSLRVLDLGAGVGGPALALADLADGDALIDYHGVEPGAAADLLGGVLDTTDNNVHTTIYRETAQSFLADSPEPFDLVLVANVLNELADPAAVLRDALAVLTDAGTLLALAPADREAAIGVRQVERAVADDGPATVYAPTARLWPNQTPTSTSWSFDVKPDLATPALQQRLQDGADTGVDEGEFINRDVQYAVSILRLDDRTRIAARGDRSQVARMADADDYVTDRVDLLAVKLSHDLAEGPNPLFLIGDGSQAVDHFAVLAEATTLNDALATADYGTLLAFENALPLWNDDEGAYNVVVDGETIVDVAER